jgi:hypothetical protein
MRISIALSSSIARFQSTTASVELRVDYGTKRSDGDKIPTIFVRETGKVLISLTKKFEPTGGAAILSPFFPESSSLQKGKRRPEG